MDSMETIFVEYFHGADRPIPAYLVVAQKAEPITKIPVEAVAILFGDQGFFLTKNGTIKLRDFCNQILSERKSQPDNA